MFSFDCLIKRSRVKTNSQFSVWFFYYDQSIERVSRFINRFYYIEVYHRFKFLFYFWFQGMGNWSDGSDNWGKVFLISMLRVLLRVLICPKQSENSDRNEFSFDSTLQIRLITFRFSHDSNPRTGTDFISPTRKDTLNSSFLCSRVSEHFPITRISEML